MMSDVKSVKKFSSKSNAYIKMLEHTTVYVLERVWFATEHYHIKNHLYDYTILFICITTVQLAEVEIIKLKKLITM